MRPGGDERPPQRLGGDVLCILDVPEDPVGHPEGDEQQSREGGLEIVAVKIAVHALTTCHVPIRVTRGIFFSAAPHPRGG